MTSLNQAFVRYPLLMEPVFSQRVWGGARLAGVLGKRVPVEGGPFGESWELSDHPGGRSRIANGPYAGGLFGDLLRRFPRELAGVTAAPERFPLLIKYIDAAEDLSIQVHPDDARAPAGERGKAECWFIMDCEPGAELIYGLAGDVDAALLRHAAQTGEIAPLLRRIPIRKGDFLNVPAGLVHAILAGTLVCEVQQSSDMTYRLWDWNRQPPRPLHIEESCLVTRYDGEQAESCNVDELPAGDWHSLLCNEFFAVRTVAWPAGARATVELDNPHGLVLNVVAGGGTIVVADGAPESLRLGQTWFLPAGLERWSMAATEMGLRLLVSESLEL